MSTGVVPGPLRHFLAQLDELRSGDILDMDQVGRLLVGLAADEEYFGPLIEAMPAESAGGTWLVKPDRGPRLVLFHRPEGVMAYTHSHHCWVAVAPVRGVETHQRWDTVRHDGGQAELRLADDRAMHRGDVATLTPLGDKYLALAEDAAGVQHQEPQQSELSGRRRDKGAVPPDFMAVLVEFQAGYPQPRGRGGPAGAPQHRPDPFQYLIQAERLGDVVVSAQRQAGDTLAEHRRGRSGR